MKKCPFCGHENDEQAKACEHCKAMIPHEDNNTEEETIKGFRRNKRSE